MLYGLKQHSKVLVYRHSAQERGGSKRVGADGLSWMFSPLSVSLSISLDLSNITSQSLALSLSDVQDLAHCSSLRVVICLGIPRRTACDNDIYSMMATVQRKVEQAATAEESSMTS